MQCLFEMTFRITEFRSLKSPALIEAIGIIEIIYLTAQALCFASPFPSQSVRFMRTRK